MLEPLPATHMHPRLFTVTKEPDQTMRSMLTAATDGNLADPFMDVPTETVR